MLQSVCLLVCFVVVHVVVDMLVSQIHVTALLIIVYKILLHCENEKNVAGQKEVLDLGNKYYQLPVLQKTLSTPGGCVFT